MQPPTTLDLVEADDLRQQDVEADHASERLIADRLDALDAERVIRRALELEAESLDQPHMFDGAQLERIAREIGMDLSFVRQALGEVRLSPEERSRIDRWILPDDLVEVATIEGLSRADAEAAIDKWMTGHEGLIRNGALADGATWDIDRRWATRLKASQRSGRNRVSRIAGSDIAHRLHTITEHEHVIAMQSKGGGPVLAAKAAFAMAALLVFFGLVSSLDQSFVGFLQSAAAFMVGGAAIAAAGVLSARKWAQGIRRALGRSLTGLAASAKPQSKSWFSRLRKNS